MSDAPAISKEQVEDAIQQNRELDRVASLRPTLDDYVSEGVLPYKPEGKFSLPVDGRRVLQMNAEANNLAAWYGDNRADSPRRKALREARSENKARKFHRPAIRTVVGAGLSGTQYRCERGHTFRFLTLGMDEREPTHPCVRDGCGGTGRLERA